MLKYQFAQEVPLYPPQTSPEPETKVVNLGSRQADQQDKI